MNCLQSGFRFIMKSFQLVQVDADVFAFFILDQTCPVHDIVGDNCAFVRQIKKINDDFHVQTKFFHKLTFEFIFLCQPLMRQLGEETKLLMILIL